MKILLFSLVLLFGSTYFTVACDVIPVKDKENKIEQLNLEVLKKNIHLFEHCFEKQTPKTIKLSYRIRHIPLKFWEFVSNEKVSEGCIYCYEQNDGKTPILNVEVTPNESNKTSSDCVKNAMRDLRFKFTDSRYDFEDIDIQIDLFK